MAGPLPDPPDPRLSVAPDDTTFRLFVESVQDYAIFMLDPEGRVVSWNRGAERIKGYREDEIVGQHFSRFYPEEAVARGWPAYELEVAAREGRFEDEGWRVRKDGSQFWANVVITAVRDDQGRLRGFSKVTRDMTERKRAEQQAADLLREQAAHAAAQRSNQRLEELAEAARRAYAEAHDAHEQLRLTFEAMAEGVMVQDEKGRIVMSNDAAARLCGYDSAAALLAAPIGEVVQRFDVFAEDGSPFPLDQLPARRVLRGEERAEALMRWRPKGGTAERWSVSKATAVHDASGRICYAISVIEDTTDRRRVLERLGFLSDAGEILSSSLAYERTLAAVARLAVPRIADWCSVDMLDGAGRVQRLAVAHVDPTKTVWADELSRRYPVDVNAPTGIGAVLRTGQPELVPEITPEMLRAGARDPDQLRILEELGLRSYICVPLTANGRTIGALALLTGEESRRRYDEQDLTMARLLGRRAGLAVENARLYTETHRALEEVTTISRSKDEFLATLSHELRTPLNAIVGWSHLLMTGGLTEEQRQKAIATISRNAQLQAQLIGDVVDVSRIVSGKVRLDVRSIDPAAVIQAALDTVAPAAAARDIRIQSVLNPDAGPISGDAERLQQVVWNLLSNAIKFTPKGGRAQVRLEAVDSHVDIVVEDNGPGIPVEFLPHVFERFRQADSSSTRVHKGLGLGLAIVRHLVELHGGHVRAENREGGGAVFTVTLPRRAVLASAVVDGRAATAAATAVHEGGPSLRGIRVMLVDDEPDARELLAVGLQQNGAEVRAFASAADVLREVGAYRPHVLLADIEMPGTDGYTLLRELRGRAPDEGGLTPAIALTAYAGTEDRIRALSAGFDLHLAKPVQLPELRAAVARLAGQRR